MVGKLFLRVCLEYGMWRGSRQHIQNEKNNLRAIRQDIRQETRLSEYK